MHKRATISNLSSALLWIVFIGSAHFPAMAVSQAAELEAGRWDVEYIDGVLGKVGGIAEVSENGAMRVTYNHPDTGAAYVLVAREMEESDGRLKIVLEGRSPESPWQGAEHRPGTPVYVSENSRGIVARGESGSNQTSMRLAERPETDTDRVVLELTRLADGEFSGRWKYRGDPLSLRAADGFGRAGKPVTDNGVTHIFGPEVWRKQRPEILGALDVADTSVLSPITSYPFLPNGSHVDGRDDLDLSRIIIVYGRNFTWSRQNPMQLEFENRTLTDNPLANQEAPISYQVLSYGSDLSSDASSLPQHEFDRIDLFYRRGREQIRLRQPKERRSQADTLDVLLIRATFKPGVTPGIHEFKIDEQPVDWLVRFSDANVSIAFARDTGTETDSRGKVTMRDVEDTPWLFGPGQFRIRVRTGVQLPVNQIPVVFGVDGAVKAIDGRPELIARRSSWDKKLYLTDPIFLSSTRIEDVIARFRRFPDTRPEALPSTRIIVPKGAELHALLGAKGFAVSSTALASAIVLDSPRATWRSPDATESANPWRAALSRAAGCHGIEITDWNRAPEQKIDNLWNVIVSQGSIQEIDVRLGDHAAMLLLRRKFLEMMRVQKKKFEAIQSDVELIALHDLIRRMPPSQSAPFAALEITGPDGGSSPTISGLLDPSREHTFRHALSREQNLLEFGLEREAAQQWRIRATRQMLVGFIAAMERAIQIAESTPECGEPEKLLELTGVGYSAVKRELLPALMTGATLIIGEQNQQSTFAISTWTSDNIARAWVQGIDVIAEAVKSQRDLARIDTAVVLTTASLGTIGFSMATTPLVTRMAAAGSVSQDTAAVIASASAYSLFAVDLLNVTEFAAVSIPDQWAKSKELEFSLGAAAVVGGGRYVLADRNRPNWLVTAGLAGLNVVGTTYGGVRAYRSADEWRQTAESLRRLSRGEKTLGNLADINQLKALDAARKIEVVDFLSDARATLQAGGSGALTTAQRAGLAKYDAMLATNYGLGNSLPLWARRVNPETLETLHTYGLMRRSDIQELLRNSPRRLEGILRGTNRDHALEIMTSKPTRNWRQLHTEMAAERTRISNPVPGFFDRNTSAENFSLIEHGWVFNVKSSPQNIDPNLLNIEVGAVNLREVDFRVADLGDLEFVSANYLRIYNRRTGQIVFDSAFRGDVPPWINVPPVNLTSRGAPTTSVLNLMAMHDAGIRFAGSGSALKSVKLKMMLNDQTNSELAWLRLNYPDEIPQQALRRLFSVQYAETAIQQAGYKITKVEIVGDSAPSSLIDVADSFLIQQRNFNLANGLDEGAAIGRSGIQRDNFYSRYFGDNWPDVNLEIQEGRDILISVAPLR